jgi:hypothetical protein
MQNTNNGVKNEDKEKAPAKTGAGSETRCDRLRLCFGATCSIPAVPTVTLPGVYKRLRPLTTCRTIKMTAITSTKWIKLPETLKANMPNSQPMMRITAMMYRRFPIKMVFD